MWRFVILLPAKFALIFGNQLTIGFISGGSFEIENISPIDSRRVLLAAYKSLGSKFKIFDQNSLR